MADPCFSVDVLGYSTSILASSEEVDAEVGKGGICGPEGPSDTHQPAGATCEANTSLGTPIESPGPLATTHFRQNAAPNEAASDLSGSNDAHRLSMVAYTQGNPGSIDELAAISHMLMDQRFVDMDRVISFDDMMFTAQTTGTSAPGSQTNGWSRGFS